MSRLLRALAGVLVASSMAVCPRTAAASSTAELVGAGTSANGLAGRILSRGAAATYFNPALLPQASPKLEAGFFTMVTSSTIRLRARPAGVDVPSSIYRADLPPDQTSGGIIRPFATADLPVSRGDTDETDTTTYAVLGIVRPLLGRHLVFGFWALLPVHSLLQTNGFFTDEREQYFSNHLHYELYGDRLKLSSFAVALGSQLNGWLSLGAGVDIGMSTRTTMTVYLPNAGDQSRVLLSPQIDSQTGFSPYFAAVARMPDDRVVAALTVHLSQMGTTSGANHVRLWNYAYPPGQNAVLQSYTFTQGWEPLRIGLGAVVNGRVRDDGRVPWQVGLHGVFERWSQYRDRNDQRPQDLVAQGGTWHNTVSLVASGALALASGRLAADLALYPSPVPAQHGRTNYVDSTRVAMTAAYEAPFELFGSLVEGGVYVRGDLLLPRTETKDDALIRDEIPDNTVDLVTQQPLQEWQGLQTNNPGYPGYKASGYMIGAGLSLRVGR